MQFVQFTTFTAVGGANGNASGEEVTLRIFEQMFNEDMMSKMTWTGKCGIKGKTKIEFRKFEQIVDLLQTS